MSLLAPNGPTVGRRMLIGWVTVAASFGTDLLLVFSPLGQVLTWDFPNAPWASGARALVLNTDLVMQIVIPIMAVLLPGSRVWRSVKWARLALFWVWVAWLAIGTLGWLALIVALIRSGGGDLGIGMTALLGGPALLVALALISLVALIPSWISKDA